MTQHQYADAVPIIPVNTTYDPGSLLVTSGYDDPEPAPPGITLTGYRAIWYQYLPKATNNSGDVQAAGFTADFASFMAATLTIWEVDGAGVWTEVATFSNTGWIEYTPWRVTGGHRYYLRVASSDPAVERLRLVVYNAADGALPPDPNDTTAHQWSHAKLFGPPLPSAGYYDTGAIDVTGFNGGEDNPTGQGLPGNRGLWAAYTPSVSATGTMPDGIVDVGNAILYMFSVVNGVWSVVNAAASSHEVNFNADVVAGRQYYLRLSSSDPTVSSARIMLLSAPAAAAPVVPDNPLPALTLQAEVDSSSGNPPGPRPGPLQLAVSVRGSIPGDVDNVAVDPIAATVTLPSLAIPDVASPVHVQVGLAVPVIVEAAITLTSPVDTAVVALEVPDFVVGLTAKDESLVYTIEVQYGDPADPDNTITLSHSAAVVDGGAILTPASPVPATTQWRARLLLDGIEEIGWSTWSTFTVDTAVETSTLELTWTVAADADRPIHVWHLDPPGPEIGETVTLYGQGFPSSGHVYVGDTELTIESWELVPANAEARTTARQINGDLVDPEHYEIVFTAPAIDGPGAALTVEA